VRNNTDTNFRLKKEPFGENIFSLRNLSGLCVSAVNLPEKNSSPQRRRERRERAEFFPTDSFLQAEVCKTATNFRLKPVLPNVVVTVIFTLVFLSTHLPGIANTGYHRPPRFTNSK